jgi:hypothetical protein
MKGGDIAGHEARDAAEARVLGAAEELFVGGNVRGIPGGDGRGVLPAPCEGDWRSSTLYRSPLYSRSNTLYRLVHLRVASHALAQRTCHFEGGGSAKCPAVWK